MNIEIGFPLLAVTQYMQVIRVVEQPTIEVKDMAMGITLSQDRDKAKDPRLHIEPLTVGTDHPFTSQLGCPIQ